MLALSAAGAQGQNPEKFERVAPPPKGQPAAPAPSPLVRELMRKGVAKESESGFCATMPSAANSGNAFYAKPAGTTEQFRSYNAFYGSDHCGFKRIASVFTEKGKRCIHHDVWVCQAGRQCDAERQVFCDNGKGSYDIVRQLPLK